MIPVAREALQQGDPVPARLSRLFRPLVASAAALAAMAFAPAAHAGLLVADAGQCADESLSQVFLPWADPANYVLAPGGAAESASDWASLDGGAAVVSGNESYYVHDAADGSSLALPGPSVATTHAMCVGIDHPTLRFFVRQTGGATLARLRVDALFEDASGEARSVTIGSSGGTSSWNPSPVMVITPSLLPLLPGAKTPVAFRFVPVGGNFQVDDVYVDPYGGH
jgi:hypothetical protein